MQLPSYSPTRLKQISHVTTGIATLILVGIVVGMMSGSREGVVATCTAKEEVKDRCYKGDYQSGSAILMQQKAWTYPRWGQPRLFAH